MNILISADPIGSYTSGRQTVLGHVVCDAVSDLPSVNDFTGHTLVMGSIADIIQTGDRYRLNSSGTWVLQPSPMTTQLDLSGYYTSAETDTEISTALSSYTDTAGMTAAIAAANYFLRGGQITATSDSRFDTESLITAGAWYFGASVVPYMDNMPPSFPATGGGNIRVIENQGTNRFIMEVTANSVAGSGIIWRRWYTTSGWGNWYKDTMSVDT